MNKALGIIVIFSCIFTIGTPPARCELTREQKVLATNIGGVLAITAWGIANWDYGKSAPFLEDERWFQEDTDKGGADKLGHFYTNYALGRGLSALYRSWGFENEKASRYGALSAFGLMGFMEIGDAFSSYGFSHSDFIMNIIGSATGYFLDTTPEAARKLDFRVEYIPEFKDADFFTDYENMRFVAVVKLDGFDAVTNPYLKYLEFHLGYYVEGYQGNAPDRSRNLYVGLGINLSKIFRDHSFEKTATFFNYYQAPYTYIKFEKDLNE